MLSKNSYWLKSGIYTILERGLTLFFGFGAIFILYRKLSLEEVGIWTQFITVTTLLELARNGLIQNGLIKFLSTADKETYPKILSSSVALNFFLGLISIFFLVTCARLLSIIWHAPILENMFYIYIITTILYIPFYHFQFIEQANFSFKGIFYSTLVRQATFFGLIAITFFYKINITLIDIAKFQIISVFLGFSTSFFIIKQYLIFQRTFDILWVKKLFHYGKFIFGTNISGAVFGSIDQMMIGNMKGNEPVGFYNLAIRISNIVEVPTGSIAAIVFPQSAMRMQTTGKSALKALYEKSVGLILGIILPLSFIILIVPQFLIGIIGGEKYMGALPILQITIFYTLIAPFTRQFGTIIDSMGNPQLNFYFTCASALLNIILNYFFIKSFGILGAAYGTLVTYLVMFIFTQIVLNKMLQVNTFKVFSYLFYYYKTGIIYVFSSINKVCKRYMTRSNLFLY